ncbi:MAG TPA: DUF397 domain-containing protein [Pseudonocardiaceae bacterium]
MALLDLYGVVDPHRAELLELGREAEQQGWLQPYHSELPEEYTTYIGFEAEARSVNNYESLLVPGLLQTETYAHAVITGGLPMASESEVEQRVRARMERQRLLSKPDPLKLWAIIDEAALHRQVGSPGLMRAQLVHLIKTAIEPNVTLQVIPYSVGAYAGMPASFALLDFPNPADRTWSTPTRWVATCSWRRRPTSGGTGWCLSTCARWRPALMTRLGCWLHWRTNERGRSMPEIDLSGAVWRKSTRSSADGQCVEVAALNGAAAVRDSTDPAGPALTFTPQQWAAFSAGIRVGEFT